MRLESLEPKNESDFYACVRKLTIANIYYERVEPANESGFPDVYFVARTKMYSFEGTIELKYTDTGLPNLRSLARGTQKAALLDYYAAGGARRFALCYANGRVYIWDTTMFARSLLGEGRDWSSSIELKDPRFALWLLEALIK
jgi:hypothetical protein